MRTHLGPLGMTLAVATLACLIVAPATPAEAAKGGKGKEHKVEGKITAVAANSITIEAHKGKKGAAGAKAGGDKTFEIGKHTRVFKEGKNGKEAASVAALKDGEHVVMEVHGRHAEVIVIHHHHKRKK